MYPDDKQSFILAVMLVGGLLFAAISWFLRRKRGRATHAIAEVASLMGFTPAPELTIDIGSMHLFSLGGSNIMHRGPSYILQGNAAGYETLLFDYVYEQGLGRSGAYEVTQTVAAFRLPGANMPDFQLYPRTIRNSAAHLLDSHTFNIEGNPEFSERYIVSSTDASLAGPFLTSAILGFLNACTQTSYCVEGYREWIIVYKPSSAVLPERFREFIAETAELAQSILSQAPRPLHA
jgi:hypothetical protein